MTEEFERRASPLAVAGTRNGSSSRLRIALPRALEAVLPALALRLRARRHWRTGEPELRLVPLLSMPGRLSVDVGANRGVYALHMARFAPRVLVIEPNPALAGLLRRGLPRRCTVRCCALSDHGGTAALRVPVEDGREQTYRASLEEGTDGPVQVYPTELTTLDDCAGEPVGFVKIDVEGHETAVLRGGARVLREDGPNLLIEAEERHRPGAVAEVAALLAGYGYRGLFRDGTRLRPIESFDSRIHQDPARLGPGPGRIGRYANNFVFTKDARLVDRLLAVELPGS